MYAWRDGSAVQVYLVAPEIRIGIGPVDKALMECSAQHGWEWLPERKLTEWEPQPMAPRREPPELEPNPNALNMDDVMGGSDDSYVVPARYATEDDGYAD